MFILELRVLARLDTSLTNGKLATQDFYQEIPVTTGRFKKTGIQTFRLLLHKVKHRIDLTFVGEHLSVGCDTRLGLDLMFAHCALALVRGTVIGARLKGKKRARMELIRALRP